MHGTGTEQVQVGGKRVFRFRRHVGGLGNVGPVVRQACHVDGLDALPHRVPGAAAMHAAMPDRGRHEGGAKHAKRDPGKAAAKEAFGGQGAANSRQHQGGPQPREIPAQPVQALQAAVQSFDLASQRRQSALAGV